MENLISGKPDGVKEDSSVENDINCCFNLAISRSCSENNEPIQTTQIEGLSQGFEVQRITTVEQLRGQM